MLNGAEKVWLKETLVSLRNELKAIETNFHRTAGAIALAEQRSAQLENVDAALQAAKEKQEQQAKVDDALLGKPDSDEPVSN